MLFAALFHYLCAFSALMVALAVILGLLPASLATAIVWELTGSALFTLLVTPVFYRIFIKPLALTESQS
jgi:multidrug efflux pump subunit AcrB